MNLTLITGNPKKVTEISKHLHPGIKLSHKNLDIHEPQSISIEEISAHKAQSAFQELQTPVIVDDTGVFFDAYNNFPGPFAKFSYQQLGFRWLAKLLDSQELQKGNMKTIISYMDQNLDTPLQFMWEIKGLFKFDHIDINLSEDNHMPFNDIFFPEWREVPVKEDYERRTKDSHRGRAAKGFSQWRESRVIERSVT